MNSQLVNAFTLALLHFVWQGAILTALAALGMRLLGERSAKLRYALACALLFAMPVVVAITTVVELRSADAAMLQTFVSDASARPVGLSVGAPGRSPVTSAAAQPMPAPTRGAYQALGTWVLPMWLLGVAILCGYRAASWIAAQRLRKRAVCAAAPEWQQRLNRLIRQLRISRPVAMLESSLTDTPLTMGVLRPVVLLPIGLLAGLPVEQIELILLHELAHIRRHDYLVNLLQTAIESLLFYHPGVWWLSRRIRMEREYCCDDIVVAATHDVTAYARTLTDLEQRRAVFNDTVLAATGGNLMFRIQRLLGRAPAPKAAMSGPLAIVFLLASCAALFGWQGRSLAPSPQQSAVAPGQPSGAQQEDKVGPEVRANSSSEAFQSASGLVFVAYEHFWHAVKWFHQLIGITPPKHTAATPTQQPQTASAPPAVVHEVSPAAPSLPTPPSESAKVASTTVQEQVRALEQRRAEIERQLKVQTGEPVAEQRAASSATVQDRIERLRVEVERRLAEMRASFVPVQFQAAPRATPYQKWLNEEVYWIISDSERTTFMQLQTDEQRQSFIEQFWLRRDPTPATEENEFREEHYRRIAWANDRFTVGDLPGWKSDQGMFYIRLGPPDSIKREGIFPRPGDPFVFLQMWRYKHIDGVGNDVILPFIELPDGGYKFSWSPAEDLTRGLQGGSNSFAPPLP